MQEISFNDLQEKNYYTMRSPNTGDQKIYIQRINDTTSDRIIYYYTVRKNASFGEELHNLDEGSSTSITFLQESAPQTYAAPAKNTTTYNTTRNNQPVFIGCAADMEVVHQVSGQCWNDAAVALLWLASGVGPIVQQRLQEPLEFLIEGEALSWWESKEIQAQLFSLFPYLRGNISQPLNYYDKLKEDYFFYIGKMKNRYELWRSLSGARKKLPGSRERSLSANLSASMEERGILSSNILFYDPEISSRYTPGLCKMVKDAAGNNPNKFTNFLYILLHILLRGNIKLLVFRDDTTQDYANIILQQHVPVIIHNPFNTKYQEIHSYYLPTHLASIFQHIDTDFNVSFISVVKPLYKSGAHGVAFLTCPSGRHYFFDDNDSRLISIEWPELFRTFTKNTTVYYLQNVQQEINLGNGSYRGQETNISISPNERAVFIRLDTDRKELIVMTSNEEKKYSFFNKKDLYIIDSINEELSYKFISISTLIVDPKNNTKETKDSIQSFSLLDSKEASKNNQGHFTQNTINKTAFNFSQDIKNIKEIVRTNGEILYRKPTETLRKEKEENQDPFATLISSNNLGLLPAVLPINRGQGQGQTLPPPANLPPPSHVPPPAHVTPSAQVPPPTITPLVSISSKSYLDKKKNIDAMGSYSDIKEALDTAMDNDDLETIHIIMSNLRGYIAKSFSGEQKFTYERSHQISKDILNERIQYFDQALLLGNLRVAQLIFALSKQANKGIDINYTDNDDEKSTFLYSAVLSGNIEVVQFLIDQGINVKANDTSKYQRALSAAANQMENNEDNEKEFQKYLSIARLLVQNGANNNKIDSSFKSKTRKAILGIVKKGGKRNTRKRKNKHRKTRKHK